MVLVSPRPRVRVIARSYDLSGGGLLQRREWLCSPGRQANAQQDDCATYDLDRCRVLVKEHDRLHEREYRHEIAHHRREPGAEAAHGPVEQDEADDRREDDEVADVEPRARRPRRDVAVAVLEEPE